MSLTYQYFCRDCGTTVETVPPIPSRCWECLVVLERRYEAAVAALNHVLALRVLTPFDQDRIKELAR